MIRLFIEEKNLKIGSEIKIQDGDFEYLSRVMRQKIGNEIKVFNGFDGEFRAKISAIEKKFLLIQIKEKTAELRQVPNITLAFSLVKNVRIDFIAAKATELGVRTFQPIITQHTVIDKINLERFKTNIKEACEQCERNDFPIILEPKKLEKFLEKNDTSRKILILCDESGKGSKASEFLTKVPNKNKEIVIIIGPEGGFSQEEFIKMQQVENLYSLNLGPRILRADTAIISALTLVQEFLGDFNLKPKFSN
jgi:16S rRNA (uracil1498-N3)-methyltransferase